MRLLFIGDVVGKAGRRMVANHAARVAADNSVDLVVVNCENAAGGFGITPELADYLFEQGADVLTSGNHIWDKRDIYEYIEHKPTLIRPGNYPPGLPGKGIYTSQTPTGVPYAVINLQGRTFLPSIDCPFRAADAYLAELDTDIRVRFVDFHAEVTSEKMAMGWHLDGRVSAVVGTHTHVPTGDERILTQGTAYLTDAGMTGPYDSIIGMEKEAALDRFLHGVNTRFEPARREPWFNSVLIDIDESTGKANKIERIQIRGK